MGCLFDGGGGGVVRGEEELWESLGLVYTYASSSRVRQP